MIPLAHITEWRSKAPWALDAQVEQDLIISRALIELYSNALVSNTLAFRGGTALQKIHLRPPARYSEDIDLVQIKAGPIGPIVSEIRNVLEPWLNPAQWKQTEGRVTLYFRFDSEIPPITKLRLKVEINTREHFSVLGFKTESHSVDSSWFRGSAEIRTYVPEELLGTKLRALFQRRKGRDLFDLSESIRQIQTLSAEQIVGCFQKYMNEQGTHVTRAEFEKNLHEKSKHPGFKGDILPLLTPLAASRYSLEADLQLVHEQLISKLTGETWKGLKLPNTST